MSKKNDQKYRITIKNWDEYQSELKGKGDRRSRRHWIAVSVHICRDPDFLRLTIEQRYAWLMLLCHAGAVGPVFELSPSDARLLFKLRHSADFQVLADQGFIDLEICNKQGLQTNKEDKHLLKKNKQKQRSKAKPEAYDRLAELKAIYPKRSGTQSWSRAIKAINARIKDGETWQAIADGVRRYAEFCRQTDKIGTEYVMMAATFCGPDKHFDQPWDPPQNKAERRTERNVAAGREFLNGDQSEPEA